MNAFLLHLHLPRLVGDGWEKGGGLVASAKRQLDAVEGTSQKIERYVSSDLAKRGIEDLLNSRDLKGITITVKAP